jgi:creatinine amidohydrolase
VLNGHGGNTGVKQRLVELANQLEGLKVQWYAWWMTHTLEAIAIEHNLKPSHANWLEAFPFTVVAELPQGDKTPPHVPSDILNAAETRQVYGDGSFGGPYQAPPEVMNEIFEAARQDILKLLEFE